MAFLKLEKPRRKTKREREIDEFEENRVRALDEFEQKLMPKFLIVAARRLDTTPEKLLEFFADDLRYGRTPVETAFAHYHSRPFWLKHYFDSWLKYQK